MCDPSQKSYWAGELKKQTADRRQLKLPGITIGGQRFPHLLYHFVLAYSNWEAASICYSESFESLSDGLQNALWELGGVPVQHQTDLMSTAVNNMSDEREFTARYEALLRHYRLEGRKIQTGKANERRCGATALSLEESVEQALLLRDSPDFASVAQYETFLRTLLAQLNAGRRQRLAEEMQYLRALPDRSRLAVGKANLKSVSIEDLTIERLRVRQLIVTESLTTPTANRY